MVQHLRHHLPRLAPSPYPYYFDVELEKYWYFQRMLLERPSPDPSTPSIVEALEVLIREREQLHERGLVWNGFSPAANPPAGPQPPDEVADAQWAPLLYPTPTGLPPLGQGVVVVHPASDLWDGHPQTYDYQQNPGLVTFQYEHEDFQDIFSYEPSVGEQS